MLFSNTDLEMIHNRMLSKDLLRYIMYLKNVGRSMNAI